MQVSMQRTCHRAPHRDLESCLILDLDSRHGLHRYQTQSDCQGFVVRYSRSSAVRTAMNDALVARSVVRRAQLFRAAMVRLGVTEESLTIFVTEEEVRAIRLAIATFAFQPEDVVPTALMGMNVTIQRIDRE